MRATTIVAMAVNHVGQRDARIESWEGTFAQCLMRLAKYLGPISMATRFDIVLARSEEEARKGLIIKGTKANQLTEGIDMDQLTRMMEDSVESASSEATHSVVDPDDFQTC